MLNNRFLNSTFYLLAVLFIVSCAEEPEVEAEDTTPPELNFSIAGSSADESDADVIVGNTITLNIDAKDAGGLDKIEAFIDDDLVGEDLEAPFQIIIDFNDLSAKSSSGKSRYTTYTLKVSATDKKGNTTSKERNINVDKESPSIFDVTLLEETVLGGQTNEVAFSVTDDEQVATVTVFLNDDVLSHMTEEEYILNLNTLEYTDGPNTLKIVATDEAENSTTYEVNFYVDNTGPELSFKNLTENQILDESTLVDVAVIDAYSSIASISFSLEDETLLSLTGDEESQLNFNPNEHPTGETKIRVAATDGLGNSSVSEVSIEILRRLITINIPEGLYDVYSDRFYVFASDTEGGVLATERITIDSRQVILRTATEILETTDYMVTFATYQSAQTNTYTNLTSIANVSHLKEMNLQVPLRAYRGDELYFPATGFDEFDLYNTYGSSQFGGGQLQEANGVKNSEFRFHRNTVNGPVGITTDKIYVGLDNISLDTYKYAIFDLSLNDVTEVREDMFTDEGIEQRTYASEISNENHQQTWFTPYGYLNDFEYENNIYHYERGVGYGLGHSPDRFFYYHNSVFAKRRYDLSMNNYFVSAVGAPEDFYPNTDLDFNHSFTNNQLTFQATGTGHIAAAFTLVDLDDANKPVVDGKEVGYSWNVIFDSQVQNVKLPELPEEMQEWGFYTFYEQNELKLEQIEIRKYESIANYDDYLDKIVKPNEHWYLVSPKREFVFKKPNSEFEYTRTNWFNFLID